MNIDTFSQHSAADVTPKIREIFLLSADPKNVSDDEEKNQAFFAKWTDYYFRHAPELIFLAWEQDQLLGYLMGALNSHKALTYFAERNPSYRLFEDQFDSYPAHLHINLHPKARGHGTGGALIEEFVHRLQKNAIAGIHLVTSPKQRNVGFYRKNGFAFELEREWKNFSLLFMGRRL